MKKLSEYRGEEALDILAELLEPIAKIIADKEVIKKFQKDKLGCVSYLIKKHKKDTVKILATLEGKSEKEFKDSCNLMTLPTIVLEVLNDKDLLGFFNSQAPMASSNDSGVVTENTEEAKQ